MNELVSIIVPIYNMGDSVESCVDSILEQDYANIEVILIDDGSKDDSYQKCLSLAAKDNRVLAIHTENRGAGPARNLGMEKAGGRYVCFPDADDKLVRNAVSSMLAAMDSGKVDLIIAGYQNLDVSGKLLRERCYPDEVYSGQEIREHYERFIGINTPCGINGAPWNKLYDLQLIKQYGLEFPPLRRHQDTAFLLRYLCHVTKVGFIRDIVYIHYLNDLRKEWYKYPADYINSVIGLFEVQKETVLSWNPGNKRVRDIYFSNYISSSIKAMELSWSPRVRHSGRERVLFIRNILEKSGLKAIESPDGLGIYHQKVLRFLQRNQYRRAIHLMRLKVFTEKMGVLVKIKSWMRR